MFRLKSSFKDLTIDSANPILFLPDLILFIIILPTASYKSEILLFFLNSSIAFNSISDKSNAI